MTSTGSRHAICRWVSLLFSNFSGVHLSLAVAPSPSRLNLSAFSATGSCLHMAALVIISSFLLKERRIVQLYFRNVTEHVAIDSQLMAPHPLSMATVHSRPCDDPGVNGGLLTDATGSRCRDQQQLGRDSVSSLSRDLPVAAALPAGPPRPAAVPPRGATATGTFPEFFQSMVFGFWSASARHSLIRTALKSTTRCCDRVS